MRLHSRWLARFAALAVMGLGAAGVAPASALATLTCVTGSGSSLQEEQQKMWSETGGFSPSLGCGKAVTYTATGSGQGLSEFGVNATEVLKPTESGNGSKLDAFVGTDDPPTHAQLLEIEKAGGTGSKPLAVPTVAAPVAVLFHPPAGCSFTTSNGHFSLSPHLLALVWEKARLAWEAVILAAGATPVGTCSASVLREVRSDSSGTSFAFKQFLCQAEPAEWGKVTKASECESGKLYVTDAVEWPTNSEVMTEHGAKVANNKSKGEVEAVEETAGSVGYANLGDAVKSTVGFLAYGLTSHALSLFWGQLEKNEPVKNTTEGNCPGTYAFGTGVKAEAEEGNWSKVHFGNVAETSAYPLCTFTYDVSWSNFNTANLLADYGAEPKDAEVAETTRQYFEYMTSTATGVGQKLIQAYYSPLPTEVLNVASKLSSHV